MHNRITVGQKLHIALYWPIGCIASKPTWGG